MGWDNLPPPPFSASKPHGVATIIRLSPVKASQNMAFVCPLHSPSPSENSYEKVDCKRPVNNPSLPCSGGILCLAFATLWACCYPH